MESLSGTHYAGAIPEPSAWLLLALGMFIIVRFGRRHGLPLSD
jgi:hypothetical protein